MNAIEAVLILEQAACASCPYKKLSALCPEDCDILIAYKTTIDNVMKGLKEDE